jgi:hypothetical protein
VRAHAQRQLWRRITDGLTDAQHQSLDQLLEVRARNSSFRAITNLTYQP